MDFSKTQRSTPWLPARPARECSCAWCACAADVQMRSMILTACPLPLCQCWLLLQGGVLVLQGVMHGLVRDALLSALHRLGKTSLSTSFRTPLLSLTAVSQRIRHLPAKDRAVGLPRLPRRAVPAGRGQDVVFDVQVRRESSWRLEACSHGMALGGGRCSNAQCSKDLPLPPVAGRAVTARGPSVSTRTSAPCGEEGPLAAPRGPAGVAFTGLACPQSLWRACASTAPTMFMQRSRQLPAVLREGILLCLPGREVAE